MSLNFWSSGDFIAGWISGICSISFGYPLETIKVKQQTMPKFGSVLHHTSFMLKNGGATSFFRGMSYSLWTTGIQNSIYFGFYGNSLRIIENFRDEKNFRSCCETEPVYKGWHLDCFLAGCIGGTVSSILNTPIELTKTILQANNSNLQQTLKNEHFSTPTACLLHLFKSNGIRGCFQGGTVLLFRDVPTCGLYAVCYEHIACLLKTESSRRDFVNIFSEGIAGGCSGVITWFLATPIDVIKSRYMFDCRNTNNRKYNGILDCINKTYRKHGFTAFFKGVYITILRAFPVNFICFVSYEQTLHIYNQLLE